ncbi:MAG: hypothetical protein IJP68_04980, partial [Selenomonadaceae bacterium]|nr:hypothetical protein [Selenomonadaceae bacterium]
AGNDTIFVGDGITSFKVEGFGAGDVIQLSATVDNLETIDGGIEAGNVTIAGLNLSATREGWAIASNVATYLAETLAGATLSDDKNLITCAAASVETVTVSGVTSTGGLAIDTANKIVTVGESSLDKLTVTISDDYSLKLANDVETSTTQEAAWSLSGTTATYSTSATTAGYTLDDNKIIYTTATGGASLVTVSGVTSTDGLVIDTENKLVIVGESSLDTLTVTISGDYSLKLANDVETSTTQEAAWKLSGTTAIYSASSTTAGYSLDDNQINYVEATGGETLINLRGIASAPKVKGNVVKLTPKNFADNVSVVAGGGYSFELQSGYYSGKTFSGSADDDFITVKGSAPTIQSSKGHDTIAGYNSRNKISLAAQFDFAVDGDDVIFNFDNNSLTIQDGAGKKINVNSTINCYTADGILDKNKKSITLAADVENFTASSNLKTIDGSATDSISILGNGKANLIYAGTGNSTLAGGRGRDTLYGGDGKDIFIYSKGDGKDFIEDCAADDTISFGSDVSIKSFKVKNDDAIIKVRGGSVTVKDAAEFRLVEGGAEKIFSGGNLFNTDKTAVTLSSAFKGTFELDDCKSVDASFTNKKITLNGSDTDNYLVGGKGKDILIGDAGNDTLTGGDVNDFFIFQAGGGKEFITDYQSGELITILDKRGEVGDFKKATFKDDTLTLSIKGGGKVIFSGVDTSTTFNINGTSYHVDGKTLS